MSEVNNSQEVKEVVEPKNEVESPKEEVKEVETKEEVKDSNDVLDFEIRGINTKSGLEKALEAKAKAIEDYKSKLNKYQEMEQQLKELEELKSFKQKFDEEQKAAEMKKLEEEKNYEEILKRREAEYAEKLDKIKMDAEKQLRMEIEKEYNRKFATMEAKDKLFKMAQELKFRNVEDVELRVDASKLIDDEGKFKEILAKESLLSLAKNRPDLLKTQIVDDSAPPSPMSKSVGQKEGLPKTKQELLRLPYEQLIKIKEGYPEEYKKLMK